jgi:hypothetical protein
MLDDNALAIAKAYNACGLPIAVWDQNFKAAYDVFTEFRPDIVIADRSCCDRAYLKCLQEFKPRVLSLNNLPLCADVITYGKFNVTAKELACDYLATISYSQSEYDLLPTIHNKTFKVFSNFQKRIAEYCGPLDDNLKPLIINSCSNFIATNNLDCLNATLMNKTITNKTSLSGNMLSRNFIINNFTTFHALKKINKNLDISKLGEFV